MAFAGYNCKSKRGFAAIVNFQRYSPAPESTVNRKCEEEYNKLKEVLPYFGYNVGYAKIDPTADEVTSLLEEWRTHNFDEYDHFLFIISAHGDQEGVFTTSTPEAGSDSGAIDPKFVKMNYEVFEQAVQLNRSLIGKPKWFVFACCHGLNRDQGVLQVFNFTTGDYADNHGYRVALLPTHADTLITHASVRGFSAFRTAEGTVLLQNLLECLNVYRNAPPPPPPPNADLKDSSPPQISLMQLCCELNALVAKYVSNCPSSPLDNSKQMCEHVNRLRADYYLTPYKSPVEQFPYKYKCMKRETITLKELFDLMAHMGLTSDKTQVAKLYLRRIGIQPPDSL